MKKNIALSGNIDEDFSIPAEDVKDATEFLFGVKVKSVRMMNVKSKPKRFGKIEGKSKTWKKAYVTLQDGQKIDFGLI